jgi:hypothetical protein
VNLCTAYATTPAAGCNSRFADSAAAATRTEPALAKFQKARKGQKQSSVPGTGTLLKGLVGDPEDPAAVRQRKLNIERVRRQAAKASPGLSSQDDAMLQYLLGDGR